MQIEQYLLLKNLLTNLTLERLLFVLRICSGLRFRNLFLEPDGDLGDFEDVFGGVVYAHVDSEFVAKLLGGEIRMVIRILLGSNPVQDVLFGRRTRNHREAKTKCSGITKKTIPFHGA